MRNVCLVAYDVCDDKRRTKVFNTLKGYGTSVQYSLFRCALTPMERLRLREALWGLIHHEEDRILVVDLGPDDGRGRTAWEAWGKALVDSADHDGILVV